MNFEDLQNDLNNKKNPSNDSLTTIWDEDKKIVQVTTPQSTRTYYLGEDYGNFSRMFGCGMSLEDYDKHLRYSNTLREVYYWGIISKSSEIGKKFPNAKYFIYKDFNEIVYLSKDHVEIARDCLPHAYGLDGVCDTFCEDYGTICNKRTEEYTQAEHIQMMKKKH